MRRYLALLVMAVFVAIQFAHIAVLDAAPVDSFKLHTQSDHDQDKEAFDGCAMHCGCHSLHHMAASVPACTIVYIPPIAMKFPRGHAAREAAGQGPPVPPPNA